MTAFFPLQAVATAALQVRACILVRTTHAPHHAPHPRTHFLLQLSLATFSRHSNQVLVLGEWPTAAQLTGGGAIAVGLSCVVASLAYEPRADAPKAAAATEDGAEDAHAERELESSVDWQ